MSYFDITWDYFKLKDDGSISLKNPCFSGPGVSSSYKLNNEDFINLDFSAFFAKHSLNSSFYITKLLWSNPKYINSNTVMFKELNFKKLDVSLFQGLKKGSYIRVYLEGHDEVKHFINMVYKAEVYFN